LIGLVYRTFLLFGGRVSKSLFKSKIEGLQVFVKIVLKYLWTSEDTFLMCNWSWWFSTKTPLFRFSMFRNLTSYDSYSSVKTRKFQVKIVKNCNLDFELSCEKSNSSSTRNWCVGTHTKRCGNIIYTGTIYWWSPASVHKAWNDLNFSISFICCFNTYFNRIWKKFCGPLKPLVRQHRQKIK
jgi:hypothetical protein